ncbi:MAG: hypothetical protein ACWGN7_06475 [Thermodesulfovibrionales bacterium]
MDDRDKLRHLAEHWQQHEREHANTYRTWAGKMKDLGEEEVAECLGDIARASEALALRFSTLQGILL